MRCRMSDRRRLLALVVIVVAGIGAIAAPEDATPESVLRTLDAAWHPIDEGTIDLRVTVRRPGKPASESDVEVSVDRQGRALCEFRSGTQKGRKLLLAGRTAWLIVPGARRAIAITDRQRLVGAISLADVARLRFADEFEASARPEREELHGVPCRVFDLRARSRAAAYATGKLWVGVDDGLARQARLAVVSGRDAKEVVFAAYEGAGAALVGRRMEFRDLLASRREEVTTVEIVRYRRASLDPAIFEPPRPGERKRP